MAKKKKKKRTKNDLLMTLPGPFLIHDLSAGL
jgi:hypothetical protein